jgi:Fur family ferric uptake transcriptional regulator
MTKARSVALEVLRSAGEPLSASDIYRRLDNCCDQVTVYRTLHYLEEHGYAESFVLHCDEHGTERYYASLNGESGTRAPHRHWFHCESCHRFIEIGTCTVSSLVDSFQEKQGVTVNRHVLYFTGLCAECRAAVGPT